MKRTWLLIVRGDGAKPRVASSKLKPKLRPDEIALTVTLDYPDGWQKFYTEGPTIKLPPPPSDLTVKK